MSNSGCSCPNCGKELKDSRGVKIHLRSCTGEEKQFICPGCNLECANYNSLVVHKKRCKVIKQQILENEILQKQEEEKKEIIKREESLSISLKQKIEENEALLKRIKEIEASYQQNLDNEVKRVEKEYRDDLTRSLRVRDNDMILMEKDNEKLIAQLKSKEEGYTHILEELEEAKRRIRFDEEQIVRLTNKESNTTMILNQNSNNSNFALQAFEPSMIQGRINPPDLVVGTVNDLMSMMQSLGVRNCFRVNDKTRGTLTWNKPGKGPIKDPDGDLISHHIVDSLYDDLLKEKVFYENELEKLLEKDDPDPYELQVARGYVNFCSRLINKEDDTIKHLKKTLVKSGKKKGDTQIDNIHDITYYKFVNSISLALFPNIHEWIELSFYELGRYIGSKAKGYYHTEGGSRDNLCIVIHDDSNYHKLIYSKKLMNFIKEAVQEYMFELPYKDIIFTLLTNKSALNQENVKRMLDYMSSPTLNITKDIMRGIVSL
jgi:hypothetical protein